MAKITKLEASGRQLDSAIRMFFANEDILAVHTVSRAAFRILYDITKEGEAKVALDAHIKKVGVDRFNEETNFLKHADRDPDDEIDDNFHLFTEAGMGMAAGRAGIIVRIGIATDSSTSVFFRDLVANRKLFSLHDFQTGLGYFDNICNARFKFCLLTLGPANIRPRGRCHRARR